MNLNAEVGGTAPKLIAMKTQILLQRSPVFLRKCPLTCCHTCEVLMNHFCNIQISYSLSSGDEQDQQLARRLCCNQTILRDEGVNRCSASQVSLLEIGIWKSGFRVRDALDALLWMGGP